MSSPATPKPSSPAPKQAWYVKLANGVEHLAVEALGFVRKAEAIEPAVQGAFGTMLGAFDKALSDVDSAAQNPTVTLSMTFDSQVFADLKSAWSAVLAFAATLGIYKK